ncbi:KAD5-like protein [Mya arenaria]|uniref:KAD5-like protein n=1 Tax=Mya arenaria TaxID=6604 RepID=A0ABY7GE17_MYAAR|nr:KAD5-like protein [Mya arenaria]
MPADITTLSPVVSSVLSINIYPVYVMDRLPTSLKLAAPIPCFGGYIQGQKRFRQLVHEDMENGKHVAFLDPKIEQNNSPITRCMPKDGLSWKMNLSFTEYHVYAIIDKYCRGLDFRHVLVLVSLLREENPELSVLNNDILVSTLFSVSQKHIDVMRTKDQWMFTTMQTLCEGLKHNFLPCFYLPRQNLLDTYHISKTKQGRALEKLGHILTSIKCNPKAVYKFTGYTSLESRNGSGKPRIFRAKKNGSAHAKNDNENPSSDVADGQLGVNDIVRDSAKIWRSHNKSAAKDDVTEISRQSSKIPAQEQVFVRCRSGKMTTEDAKTYLSRREIPRLFESLMTGLMYHRPTDHIKYLIDCLQKVHDKGQENITWSSFVDIRRTKTPLPPISNGQVRPGSKGGSRPSSKTRAKEDKPAGTTTSPLPDIPRSSEKISLPDIPIVLVLGAPGSEKDKHVDELLKRYSGWKHLNMGSMIREEIARRGDAHAKWKLTRDLMSRGEAAPEDITIETLLSTLKSCSSAKGVVITGFPRSMKQSEEYSRAVSRVDCVFMIDCDEKAALDRLLLRGRNSNKPEDSMSAVTARLNYFKAHTLPAAKVYDDQGKLVVIDGDGGSDMVKYEFGKAFDNLFFTKYGTTELGLRPVASRESNLPDAASYKKAFEEDKTDSLAREDSSMGEGTAFILMVIQKYQVKFDADKPLFVGQVPEPPTDVVPDTGRKPGLPDSPIIFVAGFVHISIGDLLRQEISNKGTADEKWTMISSLVSKGEMAPEEETVELLKAQLIKHKDAKAFVVEGFPRDKGQVDAFNKQLDGDRDSDEMFYDISQMFDFAFFGKQAEAQSSSEERELTDEELKAALCIQAGYRGYVARQQYSSMREKEVKQDSESTEKKGMSEEEEAAIRIQAGFQGYKVRKEIEAKKQAKQESTVPVQEEVVEDTITAQGATSTGENTANPAHSKTLDESAQ